MRRKNTSGRTGDADLSAKLTHVALSRRVANLPRCCLEILPLKAFERSVLHTQRQAKTLAQIANEHLVAVRSLTAQVMVNVQHVQPLPRDGDAAATVCDIEPRRARHQKKRRRVRAT